MRKEDRVVEQQELAHTTWNGRTDESNSAEHFLAIIRAGEVHQLLVHASDAEGEAIHANGLSGCVFSHDLQE
ncbi:hypothetical protein [Ralstonia solanacearum]|uniref:hypothetical protein n=1 Tax=Ralstonia solanacearum TaxID=305 RepID=UPI0012D73382|nr:hypothetical protein [Ralstonia solanacearum]